MAVCDRHRHRPARLICVARGPGWSVFWPVDAWQALPEEERRAYIAAQAACFDRSLTGKMAQTC